MIYKVLQWLKEYGLFEHYYCGKLDNKKEMSLGVYPLKRSGQPYIAFGSLQSYETYGISLLIHYNKNFIQSEQAALNLFEKIKNVNVNNISQFKAKIIELQIPQPVFVATDDDGVYEFVIEFIIYNERTEQNGNN